MQAAGFFAGEGAVDDQAGAAAEIAQLEEVRRDLEAPIELLDFMLEVAQARGRTLKPLRRADDADIVPHEPADFVPVMIDNDQFVDIRGVAALPRGPIEIAPPGIAGLGSTTEDRFPAPMRQNTGFKQRIARQAIRAVQAGAGDFANGKQSGQTRRSILIRLDAAALIVS